MTTSRTPRRRQTIIDWEKKSYEDRRADVTAESAKLAEGGMTFVPIEGDAAAAYLKLADDAAWARMYERIDGGGEGAETYKALRKHYFGEE